MSGDKMKTNGEAGETGWRGFPSPVLPAPEGQERLAGTSSPNNTSESVEGVAAGEEEEGAASWAIFQALSTLTNPLEAII